MNARLSTRLVSLASAVAATLVMLAGVNVLAAADPGAARMAQQAAPASKG